MINEVVAANDSGHRDPASPECPEFDDWIELVNDSPDPVNLDGVEIRDKSDALALPPRTLAPGAHLLIWADGQPEQGDTHAPFKVSAGGERLQLLRDGVIIDSVEVQEVRRDRSWARLRDGSEDWVEVAVPTPGAPNHRVLPDDPCFQSTRAFDDHAYPCLRDKESYLALTGDRTELRIVKFDIFAFDEPEQRWIAFVDSEFYTLHDQYYIFTALNGHLFPGLLRYPPYPGNFRTWTEVEEFARTEAFEAAIPEDQVRWSGTRLYSRYFYDEINGPNRDVGVGTVIYREATEDREEFWGFELEFGDNIVYRDLVVYFEVLEKFGPPEFARIKWIVRSQHQELLAQLMEDEGRPYADRVVRYSELATPGEVRVYNPGRTAGRVRRIRAGETGLEDARSSDILVLDEIPDYLPPCRAIITSVPQTPLSHISLLARSRGIPDIYVAGITSDPEWDAWSRTRSRVVIEATQDGGFRAGVIHKDDYDLWLALRSPAAPEIEPIDATDAPYALDLAEAGDMLGLRPLAGGKVAGMRLLLQEPSIDTPDTPLGLTVRGYHEHMAQFEWLETLLETEPFRRSDTGSNDQRLRYLILEGREAYDVRYPSEADAEAAQRHLDAYPEGEPMGDLARGTGLRGAIAAAPVPAATAAALNTAVEEQFAWLDPAQGLRFRSSSTIEDIEGFNGAGLYISATGFRAPVDAKRSVEDAYRAVWASYWGTEAFEERHGVGIDHLAGGMGVLVHPRFDDEHELSNAVLTTSLYPDGRIEMQVNAQEGAISVANPPTSCPPVLPENVRVTEDGVERISNSTELPDANVLSDEQLLELYAASSLVVEQWLAAENAILPEPQRRSVLTLDIETREMSAGWPAGTSDAPRLVIKQSRSLEPSAGSLPAAIQATSAPRDVLARASQVDAASCTNPDLSITARTLRTNPLRPPDMGYATTPFLIEIEVQALAPVPALGLERGESRVWTHAEIADPSVDVDWIRGTVEGGDFELGPESFGLRIDGEQLGGSATCVTETLWASPDQFLESFLPTRE